MAGWRLQPLSRPQGASGCQAMPPTGAGPGQCDAGGSHAAKTAPPPPPPTPLPGTAPLATALHGGLPGLRWRQRAHPRTGTMAPPDEKDFAPHLVVLIIGNVADHRGSA
jgi:hypothetical protein